MRAAIREGGRLDAARCYNPEDVDNNLAEYWKSILAPGEPSDG
ncbi:MAG: hypothetical protein ACRD7E_31875 [Bryobacteraceae bacterium]